MNVQTGKSINIPQLFSISFLAEILFKLWSNHNDNIVSGNLFCSNSKYSADSQTTFQQNTSQGVLR